MSKGQGSPQSRVKPHRRQITLHRTSNVGPPQTSHGSGPSVVDALASVPRCARASWAAIVAYRRPLRFLAGFARRVDVFGRRGVAFAFGAALGASFGAGLAGAFGPSFAAAFAAS